MSKKIAFILPHYYKYYRGGAETQCFYLASELINKGWEVHYIFEHSKLINEKDEYGIILHSLPKRKGYLKWMNSLSLLKIMQLIKADVWYSRANISYLHYLVKFAQKVGGKVVWAFSRDSQFSLKDNEQKDAILPVKIYNRFNKLRFFKSLTLSNLILLQTKGQYHLLQENLNLIGTIIYNAHPLTGIKANGIKRKKQVLWIGRMRPFKRPDRFIEIASALQDTDIEFKMVGKYDNNDIQTLLGSANLTNVEILGEKKATEVHELLTESMLLVNTSEYEGFSNTFIEAWLRGVPVFSYQVDPDNMIVSNQLGIVNGDIDILANKINEICNDASQWQMLSEKCRNHGFHNFDIIKAVNKLEESLSKI
ncbi:glycosyltransferase family 4 protein [Chondrinema litorale]|uniref:glycosyltransferase family 4 protein n=1 Tax=Chondrinema litorale TaxID=2994555 RepID=UPI0025428E27|nr:glycosyltransferase family 4 protein [Chondrinema litorale]UZS00181.1 glycosyltransferase family 4 protein [Chondrinema litorale]